MNFIKLLEKGDNLGAIKEIKSKLDGYKSGKLIDVEEELVESFSGSKKEIKESTLITEVSSKDIEELNKDMMKLNKLRRDYIDSILDDNSTKSTFKMGQELEKLKKEVIKTHNSNAIRSYLENNGISFEDMVDSGIGSGELHDMSKSLED